MAIYSVPPKSSGLERRLTELDQLRRYLASQLGESAEPWTGALRRLAAAEATVGSTSIEGYGTSIEDAVEILAGGHAPQTPEETQRIIAAYGQAMDRVSAWADDAHFKWSRQTLLELHFLICHPQKDARAGRLREGPMYVTRGAGREPYRAPEPSEVPALVDELAEWLQSGDTQRHPVIRAAMTHLNLVSIHPFRDGNGRLARVAQSLVLAKEGLLRPEFVSIEPYLGAHTREYYGALEEAQGPAFDPRRDASRWIDFCIDAHVAQASDRRAWVVTAYARHGFCTKLVARERYPERFLTALDHALLGLPVTNADYRRESSIASPTAVQDLQRLRRDGWLEQEGGGRSVRYIASARLRQAWSDSTERAGVARRE